MKNKEDINVEHRILESAADIFEEKGFAGARMQQIADHAGINKALLHYYFRTKEHLFEKVFLIVAKKPFQSLLKICTMKAVFFKKSQSF